MEKLQYKSSKFDNVSNDNDEIIIEGWANRKTVDSIGDLMDPKGCKTERYKKNPIILFNHDRSMPVGKALEYKALDDGFWVKAKLANSYVPQVKFVRDLVKQGILQMFSVGFQENKCNNLPDGTKEITDWELHEISIVPLPMNEDSNFSLVKELQNKYNISNDNFVVKSLGIKEVPMDKKPKLDEEGNPMLDEQGNPIYEEEEKVCEPKKPDEEKADAFQECVSAKIPKLIKEGKPQNQAVAIAISMCREEGKCEIIPSEKQIEIYNSLAAELISKQAAMIPTPSNNIDAATPIEKDSPILEKLDALININLRVASMLETIAQNMHNGNNESVSSPMPIQDVSATGEIEEQAIAKAEKLLENVEIKLKKLGL